MKYLTPFVAALSAVMVVYLTAGFIAWDWNPATWDVGVRFYVALIANLAAMFAFAFATEMP